MADLKRRIIAEFSAKNKAKGAMAGFRKDMDGTGQAMKRMAGQALAMAGVGGGLYAAKRAFEYITKAAMKQEDALFLLEAALKATGEYTTEAMKKYEAFAASIQKATKYGDEEVLALMQLMKSLGVTSSKLEQATRMAIGLAAATGRDVKSMSMYIALAQQGEFTMLRRYIPALRSTTDATEQLRIITEFAARGFKIAEAQAETASGAFGQMWNAVSDLSEVMGQPFLDTMAEDAKKATTNIEILTEALKKQKESVEELIKREGRLKYMPIGVPFYAPTVPKDIFVKPETPVGPLSESEALLKAAKEYHEILLQQAKEEADAVKAAAAEQTAAMQEHYEKRIAMGGNYQEMQERMARQRIETEIAVVTQQMEAEEKLAKESAERRKRIAEDIALAMASSWTNAIDRMMFEGQKFWDAMEDMARSLLREIVTIIMYKKLAEPMAYAVMGMPVPAQEGGVFTRPTLVRAGEVPEAFVPLSGGRSIPVEMRGGGGGGNLDVHIHNEGEGQFEITAVEEYAISDQRIIDVTIRAAGESGPYRRSIKQLSRG